MCSTDSDILKWLEYQTCTVSFIWTDMLHTQRTTAQYSELTVLLNVKSIQMPVHERCPLTIETKKTLPCEEAIIKCSSMAVVQIFASELVIWKWDWHISLSDFLR